MFQSKRDILDLQCRVKHLEKKLEVLTCEHTYIPYKHSNPANILPRDRFYSKKCLKCDHSEYITNKEWVKLEREKLKDQLKVTLTQLENLKYK